MFLPGDIVCVTGTPDDGWQNNALGWMIRKVSSIRSSDNHATYRHSLVITDRAGNTFEALWRYRSQNFWDAYRGCQVIVGRHTDMTPEGFKRGIAWFKQYEGKLYPVFRLLCHATQLTSKWPPEWLVRGWKPVCSEGVGGTLDHARCRGFSYYKGLTPDNLADRIRLWDYFDIIFEGRV